MLSSRLQSMLAAAELRKSAEEPIAQTTEDKQDQAADQPAPEPVIAPETKPAVQPEEEQALEKAASYENPPQTDFVNPTMNSLLELQVVNEMRGQHSYMVMSAWFKSIGLDGFSNYFWKQALEEAGHARKIMDFLMATGSDAKIMGVPAPDKQTYATPRDAAGQYLQLEKAISGNWMDIFRLAKDTDDFAVIKLAQEFLEEQIAEEDEAVTFFQKVAIAGDGGALLILDCDLAKR